MATRLKGDWVVRINISKQVPLLYMTNSRRTGTHDGAVGVPFGSIFPRFNCQKI